MNKKELNFLLMELEIYESKVSDKNLHINDDTHFLDYYDRTNEIITDELSKNDVVLALMATQAKLLKTIKNILVFFMVIFIISVIVMAIFYINKYNLIT